MLSNKFSKLYLRNFGMKRYFSCHGSSSLTLVRKPAPEFKGTAFWNNEFKPISLDTFNGKWVCLFFYPLDFTFVCPTEIVDFNTKAEEFAKLSKLFFIFRLSSSRCFN